MRQKFKFRFFPEYSSIFHRIFFVVIVIFILLINFTSVYAQGNNGGASVVDECEQWKETCLHFEKDNLDNTAHLDRYCIRNHRLLLYVDTPLPFVEARKHCTRLFESNPAASLVQIDAKIKESFQEYMKLQNQKNSLTSQRSFFTSGMCCLKRNDINHYECIWEPTDSGEKSKLIGEKEVPLPPHMDGCQSVHAKVNPDGTVALETQHKMNDVTAPEAQLNFYCQLPFPTSCGNNLMDEITQPPTTTVAPTTVTTTLKPESVKPPPKHTPTPVHENTYTSTPKPPPHSSPHPHSTPYPLSSSHTTPRITTTPGSTLPPAPGVKYCPEVPVSHGMYGWPSVPAGRVSELPCPTGFVGSAKWNCTEDAKLEPFGPVITCSNSTWLEPIVKKVEESKSLEQISQIVGKLDKEVQKAKLEFAEDLGKMTDLLEKVQAKADETWTNGSKADNENIRSVASSILSSCSHMISQDNGWRRGNREQITNIAMSILRYVQYSSFSFACSDNSDRKLDKEEKEKQDDRRIMTFQNESNFYIEQFTIGSDRLKFNHSKSSFRLVNQHDDEVNFDFLKPDEKVSDKCDHRIAIGSVISKLAQQMNDKDYFKMLNSEIVAFNINNASDTVQLGDENAARMRLWHHRPLEFGEKTDCVFFNFSLKSWREEGCSKVEAESDRFSTVCQCDHLTNFAVLLDTSGREEQSLGKSIATVVCSSATIACLLITIFVHYHCRDLRDKRGIILINLSGSLICLHSLLLGGLEQTGHEEICKGVSVGLLYSLLTSFAWMSMEGYHLFKQFFYVFERPISAWKLYLFCYGIPALLTGGIVAWITISEQELTNQYFCWISSEKYPSQIWVVAGIISFVIIFNLIITIYIISIVYTTKKTTPGLPSRRLFASQQSKNTVSSQLSGSTGSDCTATPPTPSTVTGSFFKITAKGRTNGSTNKLVNGNGNRDYSRQQSTVENWESVKKQWQQNVRYVYAYMPIIFVLGFTWASFLLYIHKENTYASYVFIVLNGLQGVFIFLTRIVFARKARDSISRRLRRSKFSNLPLPFSISSSNSRPTDSTTQNSNSNSKYS